MILIIYAHPYPHHSHANKRMLEQARTLEGVEIRSLYQLYPDFNIDIAAEQDDAPRDKCALSCAINGIHAAFHYLKKNYISGSVMTVPTG